MQVLNANPPTLDPRPSTLQARTVDIANDDLALVAPQVDRGRYRRRVRREIEPVLRQGIGFVG